MTKIGELINIEKSLLELDGKVGVPLSMKIELNKYKKEIGEITSTYFKLQYDFYEATKDAQKLSEYQMLMWDEDIEYDTGGVEAFISRWSA